jgi:D-tyrosyl-tRNA(Tyr) deacylase
MIAVIQRCSKAKVSIRDTVVGEIGNGLLVLLGVEKNDSESDAEYLVKKITKLRIFNDKNAKMNLSLLDVKGSALVVSQFTLCENTQKGRRPSFIHAASPKEANRLYIYFMEKLKEQKVPVSSGEFGETMDVSLVNNGPVTFVLNSIKK